MLVVFDFLKQSSAILCSFSNGMASGVDKFHKSHQDAKSYIVSQPTEGTQAARESPAHCLTEMWCETQVYRFQTIHTEHLIRRAAGVETKTACRWAQFIQTFFLCRYVHSRMRTVQDVVC